MSEKIYALLLHLYPPRFRERRWNDALQLFRDRFEHERGSGARVRLWLDLLADLITSLPREYARVEPRLGTVGDGVPSFCFVEERPPRPGSLLLAGLLTLAGFLMFAIPGKSPSRPAQWAQWGGLGSWRQGVPAETWPKLNAVGRHQVIEAVVANLEQHYADPEMARTMGRELLVREARGEYKTATDGAAFAACLTKELREMSNDAGLVVDYFEMPIPDRAPGMSTEAYARYRTAMMDTNCTLEKVEKLPGNIGYLKLDSFPDPTMCESHVRAAMASLNDSEAVIFDLRDNRGGYPGMVALVAAYLFDHPEYLYNPRESTSERSWTRSPVPGSKLADKPVYILTSARTVSGAEQFTYDLKMLRRATLVGEKTRGGAHAGVFYRINNHFGIGIPEVKPINPFSDHDWEGTGIEPDVKVNADDALAKALEIARASRPEVKLPATGRP